MVTYADAQQRAEQWINEGVPSYQRREVRVREFDLGFVAWAVDRADGPASDGGAVRMVISRETGATTLWPALPINDVVRRYEEAYGRPVGATPARMPSPPDAEAAEATSFLLSPPQWLKEAGEAAIAAEAVRPPANLWGPGERTPTPSVAPAPNASVAPEEEPALLVAPPVSPGPPGEVPTMLAPPSPPQAQSQQQFRPEFRPPPQPPVQQQPPVQPPQPAPSLDYAPTMLAAPPVAPPQAPDGPRPAPDRPLPNGPLSHQAAPVQAPSHQAPSHQAPPHQAPPHQAPPPPPPSLRPQTPPPAVPQSPSVPPNSPPPPPSAPLGADEADSYVPTQFAAALDLGLNAPDRRGGSVPPPPPPPVPFGPQSPQSGRAVPPPSTGPVQLPPAPTVPTVGPGYMAVLRYRGPDGSEQQIIQRSTPGMPHPEWQILQEVRRLNVPPEQVLELHTELESCDLPAGYCRRMVQEAWPNVRVSSNAAYGRDRAARQRGIQLLLEHHAELHTHAAGPVPQRSLRAPLPAPGSVPPPPQLPPQALADELVQAFGAQNVFRYEPQAVSRQGVPEVVSMALTWAGLPMDFGPFFWGQGQPGRPVPTLAELAAERGVMAGPDAGTYLVLGNDYGRQLCVQYGTAAIVAVDLGTPAQPAGPEATQPRFVNSGLPEFIRSLAVLGRLWRYRFGLTPDQAGRWTTDLQTQLAAVDPAALADPESWWAVLLEQLWDGLF
ncbi:SUKH-4 family immunity protein [Streptacidiphilus albus]|uniref:SUKH-4 family immunity protein n=1 Tax=Streptacidiphilus albus TaxID=105425 RepID=UPI00054B04EC|nr:SUKH-4 family immunity protein [Streptacidiphilus albus]